MPGNLSGSAELRYAQHTAEENGVEVLDASHFVQQYSMLWSTYGTLNKGRAGEYDFSLGYEWSSADVEIDGPEGFDVPIDNPLDKILFRGNLLLAPGGLPFQMNLYSYDMEHLSLNYRQLGELFYNQDTESTSGIVSTIQNGTHITTGMTFVAGVKNGDYRGRYRDLFTSMPRILVDFRQDEIRDLKGPSPQDYVDRDLAFVSLNKNENWFHYRFFTHEDKLEPNNDYDSQSYLLGTIDHVNRRQWIDLTNWIQISTDISYSDTSPGPRASESQQKRYDFNFYTSAQRKDWKGGAYTSFSRIRDGHSLEKDLDIPVLASGRVNRETTWRVRLENQHEQEDIFATGALEKESNLFLASRLDMYSQSRYMVSPLLDVEYKDGSRADGFAFRAGVEVYNNLRYRTDTDVFGSYALSVFNGTSAAEGESDYIEQQLTGRYARDLNADLRTGFEQELTFGSGEYDSSSTDFISADITILNSLDGNSGSSEKGNYYRSISRWYIDHRPASRIYNRLSLSYDFISAPADSGGQFSAVHNLNYYGRKVDASLFNELIFGGSLHESFNADLDLVGGSSITRQTGEVTSSFESIGRLDYDPDRRHHNVLDLELEWRKFKSAGSDQRYKLSQLYEYTFWKERGLLRKVAVLGEEIEYEDYSASLGTSNSLLSFSLFSELYPTRQTLLSARLRYEVDSTKETEAMLVFLSAGVDFEKFQMEFDYAYGTRTDGINQPERVEHKWEMKVKKIF